MQPCVSDIRYIQNEHLTFSEWLASEPKVKFPKGFVRSGFARIMWDSEKPLGKAISEWKKHPAYRSWEKSPFK